MTYESGTLGLGWGVDRITNQYYRILRFASALMSGEGRLVCVCVCVLCLLTVSPGTVCMCTVPFRSRLALRRHE